MDNIVRCKKCILPIKLPSVKLDGKGICNHCNQHEKINSNWNSSKKQKKVTFEEHVYQAKKLKQSYDCLVPLSGGKDSTYALYLCNNVYKMKTLCITFDNGYLSDYAKKNISNALSVSRADHLYFKVNRNTLLNLYGLFIERTGNFCSVCMRGIDYSMQMAVNTFKIPLLIIGGGQRVRYLGILPELFEDGNPDFFNNVVKGTYLENEGNILIKKGKDSITLALTNRIIGKVKRTFKLPTTKRIQIYDYFDVNYDEIYETLRKEMGWEKNKEQFEHMDCKIHDIALYLHTRKFPDLTTSTVYHSGLIRLGQMDRDEALRIENEKMSSPKIPENLYEFLEDIKIKKEEFESATRDWRSIDKYRKKKLFG